MENTLYQMATSGECAAATIYWLKCRMPEKWNERRQLDVTSHGDPVVIQIIDDLKDDNGEDAGSGSDKSDAKNSFPVITLRGSAAPSTEDGGSSPEQGRT